MNRTEIRTAKRIRIISIVSLTISSSLCMLLAGLPVLYGTGPVVVGWLVFGNCLFALDLYYMVAYRNVVPASDLR
jgi:hypothetical protein